MSIDTFPPLAPAPGPPGPPPSTPTWASPPLIPQSDPSSPISVDQQNSPSYVPAQAVHQAPLTAQFPTQIPASSLYQYPPGTRIFNTTPVLSQPFDNGYLGNFARYPIGQESGLPNGGMSKQTVADQYMLMQLRNASLRNASAYAMGLTATPEQVASGALGWHFPPSPYQIESPVATPWLLGANYYSGLPEGYGWRHPGAGYPVGVDAQALHGTQPVGYQTLNPQLLGGEGVNGFSIDARTVSAQEISTNFIQNGPRKSPGIQDESVNPLRPVTTQQLINTQLPVGMQLVSAPEASSQAILTQPMETKQLYMDQVNMRPVQHRPIPAQVVDAQRFETQAGNIEASRPVPAQIQHVNPQNVALPLAPVAFDYDRCVQGYNSGIQHASVEYPTAQFLSAQAPGFQPFNGPHLNQYPYSYSQPQEQNTTQQLMPPAQAPPHLVPQYGNMTSGTSPATPENVALNSTLQTNQRQEAEPTPCRPTMEIPFRTVPRPIRCKIPGCHVIFQTKGAMARHTSVSHRTGLV